MPKQPAHISPETAAWLHTQMALHGSRTAVVLREEIRRVDDWASGVFVALRDVLCRLLMERPELARQLAVDWRIAAARFDAIEAGYAQPTEQNSLELLEARRLLLRALVDVGAMPKS